MSSRNHIIKKQIVDLTLDSAVGSFSFQSKVSEIFRKKILPVIDAYCSKMSSGSEIIRIDKLQIDLGVINKKTFETDFIRKFDKIFPPEIQAKLSDIHLDEKMLPSSEASLYSARQAVVTNGTRDFEILEFFMEEGRLPWWVASDEPHDIVALLEWSVTSEPVKTKELITRISGNPESLKRLVYHAGEAVLAKIIALFQPRIWEEIYELSNDLIHGLAGCPSLQAVDPFTIGTEVWAKVLAWSALSEEKRFKRKLLAEIIIKHVAGIFASDLNVLAGDLKKDNKIKGILSEKPAMFETGKVNDTTDFKILEYLRQLAILEIQFNELTNELSLSQAVTDNNFPEYRFLQRILKELSTGTGLIQSIRRIVDQLLRKSGKTSTVLLSGPDGKLQKKAAEFEEWLEKLHFDLTGLFNRGLLEAEADRVQTISKCLQSMEAFRGKALLSEEAVLDISHDPANVEEIYVGNGGLVVLWPYLAKLFEIIGLTEGNRFVNKDAAEMAALVLHYLAWGNGVAQEYELPLNKILCGMEASDPFNPSMKMNQNEEAECEKFLQAVIGNWPALKNMSVPSFRKMFLQREGMIFTRDGQRVLRVAEETYDILLDKMPWGIGTVKLPWMEQILIVEWRV